MKEMNFSMHKFQLLFLFLSFLFGSLNINIGFSLKPFMIITIINLFLISKDRIHYLLKYEKYMLLFMMLFSLTAIHFRFPFANIRFIFLFFIIISFYFINRNTIENIDIETIENMLSYTGIVGISTSLLYYFYGIYNLGFDFASKNLIMNGVTIDRHIPRLIGLVANDPNVFVFLVSVYFFYYLTHLDNKRNKLGLVLFSLSIILSFSRGAYISILFAFIIYFIFDIDLFGKVKFILLFILLLFVAIYCLDLMSIDIYSVIDSRFKALTTDGGSGRLELWTNALNTFKDHPFFGIGINSTVQYGDLIYGNAHYIHNTYLEVLSEGGIICFIAYFIFLFSILKKSYSLMKYNYRSKFIFYTIISMYFQMIFLSLLYNEAFYLCLVLLYRYSFIENDKKECYN